MKFGTNLSMKIWGVLFALVAFVAGAKADNKLVIEDFDIIPGETKTISVALDNTDNISSLQFDIDLPEGLSYVNKSTKMNKARLQMHALSGARRSESHVRFGIFHQVAEASKMDKSLILGNSGEIFTFEVKASYYYKGGEIKVYGIQGSDATPEEPVEHDMESFTVKATPSVGTFSLTETSVVKNLNTDNTFSVGLSIANIVDICGLQAYVELPENLVIESMEIGERVSENYIVTPSDMDKSGTILLSSIMAENFEGYDGVVITFNLKAVGAVKGQFVVKDLVATEKTGEASFKIGEAQSVDVEVKPFATIAEDAAVTLPEGELEADEDGFVKATLTGKITVDESIAENAQAVLVYTLKEVSDETEGGETEPTPEEPTTKGGGLFDKDQTDDEYAMLDFDVESQEVNIAVEAGKKYTLTVKSIVVNYYDENAGEGGDQVVAAEKKFEGDNAIVIDFATAAPILATIADDATVTLPEGELEADEDGFVKATLTGKITVDESIAENAQAVLVYTLKEVSGETEGGETEPTPEEPTTKGGGLFDKDETDEEYAMLDFDVESQEVNIAVEAGKKYTLTVKSIVVNYYDENAGEGGDQVVAAEKKFEGDNAIVIDFATAAPILATIADDATVTLPEGELEADEDGFVKATLTGKITVDESIAENAQAVLVYTLKEVSDETEGGETEPTPEEPTTKGGGLFDKDETDEEYAMLDFDVESQEVNIAVEAGKKYTLTVKSIVVNYYDENAGEGGDQVVAAEKKFEGDNAIVIDFTTAAPAPVLATLDFVALATGDDAAISEEDGTYPVVFSYGLTLDESIAATAYGAVTYTVYNGEDVVGTYTTDFDVAKEERTIYVEGLEYSTAYTISIDKVVISYLDAETLEPIVAGEFTEPTSSVYFTTNAKPEPVPTFDIAKEFTSLESLKGAVFTIVNKETGKALYGSDNQNLGYDVAEKAFAETNSGFYFKIDTLSQGTEDEACALRLLTPAGDEYSIWGEPGYLNSQIETGWCSFILGLNNQNGRDLKDGAAWDIQYVEGKGFTLLNKGTGKYLTSNDTAKSDEPVYWTFCTINGTKIATGINGTETAAPAANRKVVENGKVVIYRNGVKTTVSGINIK